MSALIATGRYRLSPAEVAAFQVRGHAGPFRCEAPGIRDLPAQVLATRLGDATPAEDRDPATLTTIGESAINLTDPHRDIPAVRAVIEHPSIVNRVAQCLGSDELRYFQSRYRVKLPERADRVEWHQDIGPKNGGCYPDGRPIPTVTVWLGIDGATREDGCVQVIPGTHNEPLGDWRRGYSAGLEAAGQIRHLDLDQAVALETAAGEFQILHSWLVHISGPNLSDRTRTGLVARFIRREDAVDPAIHYFPCRAS